MTGVRLLAKERTSSSHTPPDKHWMRSASYAIGAGHFPQAVIAHRQERESVADFLLQQETVLAEYSYRANITSTLLRRRGLQNVLAARVCACSEYKPLLIQGSAHTASINTVHRCVTNLSKHVDSKGI
jgi:hypothetical protein